LFDEFSKKNFNRNFNDFNRSWSVEPFLFWKLENYELTRLWRSQLKTQFTKTRDYVISGLVLSMAVWRSIVRLLKRRADQNIRPTCAIRKPRDGAARLENSLGQVRTHFHSTYEKRLKTWKIATLLFLTLKHSEPSYANCCENKLVSSETQNERRFNFFLEKKRLTWNFVPLLIWEISGFNSG
jgi:hypothetical protein